MAACDLSTVWLLPLALFIYWTRWQLTTGASRRQLKLQHGCRPPPKANNDVLFGITLPRTIIQHVRKGEFLEYVRDRYQRVGYTHQGKIFFSDWIFTNEPENIKTILATKFKQFDLPDMRKSAVVPLLGKGIFVTDGAQWQHSREMLRPNFVRSQVGDLEAFEEHLSLMMPQIPGDGQTPINISKLFFKLTIDSATKFLFGESTNTLIQDSELKKSAVDFAGAFDRSQAICGMRARSGFFNFLVSAKLKADIKTVHDFVDRFVERGLRLRGKYVSNPEKAEEEAADGKYIFLNELVKQTGDPVQIRDECLSILLAGRDTTASLLTNMFFVFSRHAKVWKRLQAEVAGLEGKIPTYELLKDMKYLRACMNEG